MKRGDQVRIPEGTVIWGTFKEGIKEAGHTYTVSIMSEEPGYPASAWGPGREPAVCWVGSGGYRHYARIEDVEAL